MDPDQACEQETAGSLPTLTEMRVFAERLLARREYAVHELQARLARKWSRTELVAKQIDELIAALQADGVLSDERFAESFIRSRCQRYQGPAKIKAQLRRRGVPETVITGKLLALEDEWTGLAATWLSRQACGPMDYANRAKYYRRLLNRGFSHQQAMDALARQPES